MIALVSSKKQLMPTNMTTTAVVVILVGIQCTVGKDEKTNISDWKVRLTSSKELPLTHLLILPSVRISQSSILYAGSLG